MRSRNSSSHLPLRRKFGSGKIGNIGERSITIDKELTHIDLFSGIGGFTLAAEWAGFKTVVFCEKEKFCQKILKKHWPEIPIIPEIKDIIEETKVWREFVQNVNKEKSCQTVHIADNATPREHLNGEGKIKKNIEHLKESGVGERRMKLSSTMEANVSVVGKPKKNSLQSTTNIIMGMPKEGDINRKHGNSYSKEACPMTTKSYVTTATMHEHTMANAHIKLEIKIDLLTAGVPCQPASVAGKRGGKTDARWLWPETLEVIQRIKPTWCLLENVTGILSLEGGMEFENVCIALEECGYEVRTFIIPACGLNAPHRRNRVWIVGYSTSKRKMSISQQRQRDGIKPANKTFKNSSSKRLERRNHRSKGIKKKSNGLFSSRPNSDASNSPIKRLSKSQKNKFEQSILHAQRGDWEKDWYEVAARFCRVDDGVSDRVHRLKARGNAIVPQVAYEILKNIAWIENELA